MFDPTFPSPKSIDEGFRVFAARKPPCTSPASQAPTPLGLAPELIRITIVGAHQINKDGDHVSGGTAWFGNEDPRNISIKLSEELAGPGAGETGVLLMAISMLPTNAPLHISTNASNYEKT
jgi:hypothetical protein